jgi:MFS family permease
MTTIVTTANSRPPGIVRLVATVFMPFAGGYFLSYLFRSINAIIAPQLVSEVGLSAGDLGLLTSAYFFAFAAFQIPLGMLLDRFGPRRVQAVFLLSAALGALLFSFGHSKEVLALARGLIGLGVAGGLMSSFKAITIWFPQDRWPLVNGCFMAMGGLGAVSSTIPLEFALHFTDWRGVFVGLSIATICVSAIIFLAVPEKKAATSAPPLTLRDQLAGIRHIYTDRLFWRLAPIAVTALAANMAIQSLWAGPWLRDVAGYSRDAIAQHLFLLNATMTVGFVACGVVSDIFERRGFTLNQIMGTATLIFMVSQGIIAFLLDPTALWPWIVFGMTMNFTVLAYTQLTRHFPMTYSGRAITALNVLAFGGVFLAQSAMGEIIDLWAPKSDGGYQDAAYMASFGTLIAVQAAAFLWFLIPGKSAKQAG